MIQDILDTVRRKADLARIQNDALLLFMKGTNIIERSDMQILLEALKDLQIHFGIHLSSYTDTPFEYYIKIGFYQLTDNKENWLEIEKVQVLLNQRYKELLTGKITDEVKG